MPTLPGIEYLGKGFNLLGNNGIEPKMSDIRPLLTSDLMSDSYTISGITYQIPSGVGVSAVDYFGSVKTECSTTRETEEEYTATFGVQGKYGGFSAKLEGSFSKSSKESTNTNIVMIQQNFSGYDVGINVNDRELRLTPGFSDALNGNMTPDQVFRDYGTHMIKGIQLGGKLTAIYSSKTMKKETMTDFSIKAEAKYKGMGGSVSAKAGSSQSSVDKTQLDEIYESLKVFGGTPETQIRLGEEKTKESLTAWAASVGARPTFACITAVAPIWELCKNDNRKKQLENAYKSNFTKKALSNLSKFKMTSENMTHRVEATLKVPDDYKILSGGAQATYTGGGILLTASYPQNDKAWTASGRDHLEVSTGSILISVTAVYDPFNMLDVKQWSKGGIVKAQRPTESATVDPGYTLVGGGAKVNWEGNGVLLTASYPDQKNLGTWSAKGKDHEESEACTITAYAIGIKPNPDFGIKFKTDFSENTSTTAGKPYTQASTANGYQLVGGGAQVNWKGNGNLLTESYADDTGMWSVKSKDHINPDSCTITAYAIGLQVVEQ